MRNIGDKALLAKALHGLGTFYHSQGDHETARNLYTEGLQIRRELGDKHGIVVLENISPSNNAVYCIRKILI